MNMVTTKIRIPYKYGDIIKIKPLFDVHLGNKFCDISAMRKYLKRNDDEQTYIIGGGDILDSIIVTDKRYRKTDDDTTGEDIVDEQIDVMYKELLPYKKRILGLGTGNHEDTISKKCATNPIRRLCKLLDVIPLGYDCMVRLNLHDNNARGRSLVIR